MGSPKKYKIELNENEKKELETLVNKHTTSQNIAKRAKIILMANKQNNKNIEIAKAVGTNAENITKWTKRWTNTKNIDSTKDRLADLSRSGKPPTITAEQWCQIMALACEKPKNHGIPITQWSHSTLTAEILKQKIVPTISTSWVGDFLKKQNYNPIKVPIG